MTYIIINLIPSDVVQSLNYTLSDYRKPPKFVHKHFSIFILYNVADVADVADVEVRVLTHERTSLSGVTGACDRRRV